MSKFLAFAEPCRTDDEAKEIVSRYKKEYFDARHCCWAYMLGADRTNFRSNEQMTQYSVINSVGTFPVSDTENEDEQPAPSDSVQSAPQRGESQKAQQRSNFRTTEQRIEKP